MAEKTKDPKELIRVIKFTLISISAGLVEIISFSLLELTGLDWWINNLISLTLSVLWNFTINRRYTFMSASNVPLAMFEVACFYAVFAPLTTIGGNYLTATLGWNDFLVKALTMLLNITLEFLYMRYFVFRNSIDTNLVAKKQEEKRKSKEAK